MSLKSLASSDHLAFLRRSWPFFLIAFLIVLLLDSWRQTPPAPVATVTAPLPIHTPSVRTVAGSYQQDAPSYRPYPETVPTWQQGQAVPATQQTIWQANSPTMPRYRPLAPANQHTRPLSEPPSHRADRERLLRFRDHEAANTPQTSIPWSQQPYRQEQFSYPPMAQPPSAATYAAPSPHQPQQYYRDVPSSPAAPLQWPPRLNQPHNSVGVQVAPNNPYYPAPVWQSQPPGASYRLEPSHLAPIQPKQWYSPSLQALP